MLIFATKKFQYLKKELMDLHHFEDGELHQKTFPDGEHYTQIVSSVENKKVLLIGGTIDDISTLELYDLAIGIVQQGASQLSILIPYFGYATMERAVKNGEIVMAKNRAILFSSIPKCAYGNKIYLMDLHAEGLPYYFGNDIKASHIYCKEIFLQKAKELFGNDLVFAATDAGRAKWIESLAMELNVPSAFVYKQRKEENNVQITGVNADVKDKNIVLYDDMIRTGNSLIKAAEAYKNAGAKEIVAMCTHGIFCDSALQKIEQSNLFSKIISTNSHPTVFEQKSALLEIISISPIIINNLF
jgi:ribose-phosphate pyrophosphokinase